jgi:hypothetical protein
MSLLTVLELHAGVREGLQKMQTTQGDDVQPEEIDYYLNKEQDKLWNDLVTNNFQNPVIRQQLIQNLIEKNKKLPVYVTEEGDDFFDGESAYAVLPANFGYLLSSRPKVYADCQKMEISNTTSTEYFITMQFPISEQTTGPYYISSRLTINGVDNYVSEANLGYNSAAEYFQVVKEFMDKINKEGKYGMYWERYDDFYQKNSFIIVSGNTPLEPIASAIMLTYYEIFGQVDKSLLILARQRTRRKVDVSSITLTPFYGVSDMKESDDIYSIKKNTFYASKPTNPYGVISGNKIFYLVGKNFIITDTLLDYVRKPQTISLYLNQSCEFGGTAPNMIIDGAVQKAQVSFWRILLTKVS